VSDLDKKVVVDVPAIATTENSSSETTSPAPAAAGSSSSTAYTMPDLIAAVRAEVRAVCATLADEIDRAVAALEPQIEDDNEEWLSKLSDNGVRRDVLVGVAVALRKAMEIA